MNQKNIDYTFMKTGSNLLHSKNELDNETKIDIITLILTFAENSLHSSEIYTKHSNRSIITKQDLIMAMRWEVFMFIKRNNIESLQKNKEKVTNEFKNSLQLTESECVDYLMNENNCENCENITEKTEEYNFSTCKCNICTNMNRINERWKFWEPTTNLEIILKKAIDKS